MWMDHRKPQRYTMQSTPEKKMQIIIIQPSTKDSSQKVTSKLGVYKS